MKKTFTASIWQEADWYIAQCLEVDVASQGETKAEALENLKEALELHFEDPSSVPDQNFPGSPSTGPNGEVVPLDIPTKDSFISIA